MKNLHPGIRRISCPRHAAGKQQGATMVEFVIVSPIAILLLLGIIQLALMMVAKQVLNQATLLAARAGAVQNAQKDPMQQALNRALLPFYQNTFDTNAYSRLTNAALAEVLSPPVLNIEILNPSQAVFNDFGLTDNNNNTYIPNDSLEYRDHSYAGPQSGLTIQDANALKIRVTYGYQLKVPLMQSVFKSVMCGFDTGVDAFGRGSTTTSADCATYYNQGLVPIVSYATVQMHSNAMPSN
jgi:hypothetical protein